MGLGVLVGEGVFFWVGGEGEGGGAGSGIGGTIGTIGIGIGIGMGIGTIGRFELSVGGAVREGVGQGVPPNSVGWVVGCIVGTV